MAEEAAAPKSKAPKSKKSGPDKATKAARTYERKVKALERHLKRIASKNARRRKKDKEEIRDDKRAVEALARLEKKGSVTPRRTPNSEKWTHVTKDLAHQHRLCGYRGNIVLRFGQQGMSLYEGQKPYAKRESERLTSKFMAALAAKKEAQAKEEADKRDKQREQRMIQEAAARRRMEEEKKKLGKSKSKTPSKPQAKAKQQDKPAVKKPEAKTAPKKKAPGKA